MVVYVLEYTRLAASPSLPLLLQYAALYRVADALVRQHEQQEQQEYVHAGADRCGDPRARSNLAVGDVCGWYLQELGWL